MITELTWGKIKLTPAQLRAIKKAQHLQRKKKKKPLKTLSPIQKPKPSKEIISFTGVKIERSKYQAYQNYMKSPEWAKVRKRVINLRGRKCQKCNATKCLEVHHKHYANLFNEKDEDLEVLCRQCHSKEHRKKKKRFRPALHT